MLAIDELPYLCETTPSLASVIQRWWDAVGQHLPIVVILAGSHVSFMERLAAQAGELYGRRTRLISLQPFDYLDAGRFLPGYTPTDRLRAYAVVGGMPAYLARFSDGVSLARNILEQILEPGAFLRDEARWILIEELRSEATYHSVMAAIARGKTRPSEIAADIGATGATAIGPYLNRLADMRLIERRLPVTDDPAAAVRRGLHAVADQYLTFWFRFVAPSHTYLEGGMAEHVLGTRILPDLDHHVSRPAFEDAARQYLLRRQAGRALPVAFSRIGGWWRGRGAADPEEIDVVAADDRRVVLVGECKWSDEWVKLGDLNELRRKAAAAGFPADVRYALFAKSGFDPNLAAVARAEGVLLATVDDMYAS